MSKKCPKCQEIKSADQFGFRSDKPTQLYSYCKACVAESRNRGRKAHNEKITRIILDAKNVPCTDCGETYPYYVMDFDHRPGEIKYSNISRKSNFWTVEKLNEEIAKCDVVCANCHRIRTHARTMAR